MARSIEKRKAKRRKRVTISRADALFRLRAMLNAVEKDVEIAIATEAALESANDTVKANPTRKLPGADTYNAVRGAMTVTLAMALARLFDEGSQRFPANKRDIASLPLMLRLLAQKRCCDALAHEARGWTPHIMHLADRHEAACRDACERAIDAMRALRNDPDGRAGIVRLRLMRNHEMAHSFMFPPSFERTIYRQLFRLTAGARDIVQATKLAVDGLDSDMSDVARICYDDGIRFWSHAFRDAEQADA